MHPDQRCRLLGRWLCLVLFGCVCFWFCLVSWVSLGKPGAAPLYKVGAGCSNTAARRASETFAGSGHSVTALWETAGVSSFLFFPLVAVADASISPSVSHQADSYLTEYENIEVPDSYCGPRLSFPLTLADANALLHAFKDGQVRCN